MTRTSRLEVVAAIIMLAGIGAVTVPAGGQPRWSHLWEYQLAEASRMYSEGDWMGALWGYREIRRERANKSEAKRS